MSLVHILNYYICIRYDVLVYIYEYPVRMNQSEMDSVRTPDQDSNDAARSTIRPYAITVLSFDEGSPFANQVDASWCSEQLTN